MLFLIYPKVRIYKIIKFIYPKGKDILAIFSSIRLGFGYIKFMVFSRWVRYEYPLSYTHGWGKKWVCIFYLINFFKENFHAKIFFKGPNSMGCNA
jgi:hypothetical protein